MSRHLLAFLTAALVLAAAVVQYLANQPAAANPAKAEPAGAMPTVVREEYTVWETIEDSCGTKRVVPRKAYRWVQPSGSSSSCR